MKPAERIRLTSVTGARPQFIKASMVSRALEKAGIGERLLHTGQHYDEEMSAVFFKELGLKEPARNLETGSGTHAVQTAKALAALEEDLIQFRPDAVLVYGDTNGTLAGALAAAKLGLPVFHVEAGLRSFNRDMPEEVNRIVVDRISALLFAPAETAMRNLEKEGLRRNAFLTGDVMCDALKCFKEISRERSKILETLGLAPKSYQLLTIHRPSNADDPRRLGKILDRIAESGIPTVFPVHPRTRKMIPGEDEARYPNIRMTAPAGYLDMLELERHASRVLTDSGGVQKEAYLFKVPCVTLRAETEWEETTRGGWNLLLRNEESFGLLSKDSPRPGRWEPQYGDGRASEKIAAVITDYFSQKKPERRPCAALQEA